MELTENQILDYKKYYVEDPKGFSPERNKAIVDQTIKDYEEIQRVKKKVYEDQLGERVEATASYLMHLNKGGGASGERYFGKKELARLRGEQILEELKKNKVFGKLIN